MDYDQTWYTSSIKPLLASIHNEKQASFEALLQIEKQLSQELRSLLGKLEKAREQSESAEEKFRALASTPKNKRRLDHEERCQAAQLDRQTVRSAITEIELARDAVADKLQEAKEVASSLMGLSCALVEIESDLDSVFHPGSEVNRILGRIQAYGEICPDFVSFGQLSQLLIDFIRRTICHIVNRELCVVVNHESSDVHPDIVVRLSSELGAAVRDFSKKLLETPIGDPVSIRYQTLTLGANGSKRRLPDPVLMDALGQIDQAVRFARNHLLTVEKRSDARTGANETRVLSRNGYRRGRQVRE